MEIIYPARGWNMDAHETWEGMVLVGSATRGKIPYQLDDPEEMISFLDEDSGERSMGKNAVDRADPGEGMGTYIH